MSVLLTLLPLAVAGNVPGDGASWSSLQSKPVPVWCTEAGGNPWCRSEGIVQAPVDQVVEALQNMRHNASLFQSVVKIDIVTDDILHIVLDYPAPLDDRDYVAAYTYSKDGDAHVFEWQPANQAYPEENGVIRLPNFAGSWRLEARGGFTWVRYTWQAEINGSFPSFAYNTAWKRAGQEALQDLAHTQSAKLTAP